MPLARWRRTAGALLSLALVCCGSRGGSSAPPEASCGDGVVQTGEECDDANTNDADGCLRTCLRPASWVLSDPHIHAHGCGGDLEPNELLQVSAARGIEVTSALVWGDGYDDDRRHFTGIDDPASVPGRLIHYDMEISHFPAANSGHLVLLGLPSIDFSSSPFRFPQSGIPVADWALAQNPRVVVGMAHGQFWPADGRFPSPPVDCCMPWDIVADAVRGRVQFLETERRNPGPPVDPGTLLLWTKLQNAGLRVALAGASDYPCIHHFMSNDTPRTDVLLDGDVTYDRWLDALRAGRTSVVVGGSGYHLDLRVNGARVGDELDVAAGERLHVSIESTSNLPANVQVLVNGVSATAVLMPAGVQAAPLDLELTQSSWITASTPWAFTSPIYVIVNGAPIRPSASDICYLRRYLDHLSGLVRGHRVDLGGDTSMALGVYAEAQTELQRRFAEAGGVNCP